MIFIYVPLYDCSFIYRNAHLGISSVWGFQFLKMLNLVYCFHTSPTLTLSVGRVVTENGGMDGWIDRWIFT